MQKDRIHSFISSIPGRTLLHLLFWLGVTFFLTLFFGHFQQDYRNTFLFVCLLIPIAVATTYFINYHFSPATFCPGAMAALAFILSLPLFFPCGEK